MKLPKWLNHRGAGVLLHPTSLPGGHGIGCLDYHAYAWIDFLAEAGFSYWQMCPVGPTGYGDSPYQVFSSSAGNPYLIDLNPLISKKYLTEENIYSVERFPANEVDYGLLYQTFYPTLRIAFKNFKRDPEPLEEIYGSLKSFIKKNSHWLEPFAKYQAIKNRNNLHPWWKWNVEDRNSFKKPLSESCQEEFDFHIFLQYLFRAQWDELHQYAKSKNISLIGDLPIYVAPDSSDTWYNRDIFQISDDDNFKAVAGVPPDYFNEDGQLWGNPLYDWGKLKNTGYEWWIKRIQDQLELFEIIRIDHFRAFYDYWSVPSEKNSAKFGTWQKGPGLEFWEKIKISFPDLPFLAEDLGDISKGVRNLRTSVGLPGMAVLQFAFDGDPKNLYLPHNLSKDIVLYSGTHDNDTSCSWYNSADEGIRSLFRSYLNVDGSSPSWDMIRQAYRSTSHLIIILCQDLLSLGNEARFNKPGEAYGNWTWRMTGGQFSNLRNHSTHYLREQALLADRLPKDLV